MKRFGKLRLVLASAMATLFTVAMSGVAYATCSDASDPTACAGDEMLVSTKGWITTHGIPMLTGLLVIGLIVGLLVKFGKRGAKAA